MSILVKQVVAVVIAVLTFLGSGEVTTCLAQCAPDWSDRFSATTMTGGLGSNTLVEFDDGSGPCLYAAGVDFLGGNAGPTSSGLATHGVARWNGRCWEPVGSGLGPGVRVLAVFDSGSGPALYAGGSFPSAGGVTVNGLAKWDGTSWSGVGGGVAASSGAASVQSLAVFD